MLKLQMLFLAGYQLKADHFVAYISMNLELL